MSIKAFRRYQDGSLRVSPDELKDEYWAVIEGRDHVIPVQIVSCSVLLQGWELLCKVRTQTEKQEDITVSPDDLYESPDEALEVFMSKAKKYLK